MKKNKICILLISIFILISIIAIVFINKADAKLGGTDYFVSFAHKGYDSVKSVSFDGDAKLFDDEGDKWTKCNQVMCIENSDTSGGASELIAIIDINPNGDSPDTATITLEVDDGNGVQTFPLPSNSLNKTLAAFAYYVETTNMNGNSHCNSSANYVAKHAFIGGIWEGGYRQYIYKNTSISLPASSEAGSTTSQALSFAESYAEDDDPDTVYAGRIFLFRSGGGQARAVLFGKALTPPPKNNPTINKHITRVDYPDGTSDTYSRSGMTENEKKANPVVVIPGSTITYQIDIGGEGEDTFTVTDSYDNKLSHVSGDLSRNSYVGDSFTVKLKLSESLGSAGTKYKNEAKITEYSKKSSDYVTCEYEDEADEPVLDNAAGNYKKYIIGYTRNGVYYSIDGRSGYDNTTAKANPVTVKKGDVVRFKFEVTNTSSVTIDNLKIQDTMESGLTYGGQSSFIHNFGTLEPEDTKTTTKDITVTKSDMYLQPIKNTVSIKSGTYEQRHTQTHRRIWYTYDIWGNPIPHVYTWTEVWYTTENIKASWFSSNANEDYVQLDDVEIAGKVWIDKDKDGQIDSGESTLSGIPVKLYRNNALYKTETTNSSGNYSFGTVPKGDKPYNGGTRKYDNGSGYYKYHVIFEYNGVQYETTKFEGTSGVKDTGTTNNWNYKSHAQDIDRTVFNNSLETIAYNKAYAGTTGNVAKKVLEYTKSGHTSTLKWTAATTIQAKSIDLFVNVSGGDTIKADHVEYLKHINLGLVEKEQGDLSLKKDVISAEVTVNGYKSTYNYGKYGTGNYTGTYKLKTPYVLSLYRGDYDFRSSAYPSGFKSSSDDLNIKLTYRVTLKNESGKYNSVVREVIDISSDSLDLKSTSLGTVANTSSYNSETSYAYSGYQVHYINMNTTLAPNAETTFDLVYTVKKNSGAIILGTKANMAQIGAYSIYNGSSPAGVVDKDSNPGIVNPGVVPDITKDTLYEDHCYYTSIIIKDTPPSGTDKLRRKITGNVWEDLNTTTVSQTGQKTGDGKKNSNEKGAQNVTVVLLEVVKYNGTEYLIDTGLSTETNANGDYTLMSSSGTDRIHAGEYVVRFIYGDEASEFVTTTGDTIRFSGQDYKSTTYTPAGTSTNDAEVVDATAFATLKASKNAQVSVARDDEIRRLEVINYSTQMTYKLDSILKAHDSATNKAELAANTSMFADTKVFNVQIEKTNNTGVSVVDSITENVDGTKTYTYAIGEVNFGLIERPITKLELMDDIKEITATTASGEEILHIYFDISYNYNSTTKRVERIIELNETLSTGEENVQMLDRTSTTKGFRYVNIDSELLQGMKVVIKYQFAIANIGDIDTSNENLINMVKDYNVDEAITKLNTSAINSRYKLGTGSGINSALLKNTTFTNVKSAINGFKTAYGNYRTMVNGTANNGEYNLGYFLGNKYYGTYNSTTDKIVETRVDQIISYVDNDLVFSPEENTASNGAPKFLTYSGAEIEAYALLKDVTAENASTKLVDGDGVSYITNTKNNLAFNVEDAGINGGLYKYLRPLRNETTAGADKLYIIELNASRVLASQLDVENVVLDNLAEIVKISNTAGRKAYIEFVDTQTGNVITPGPSGPTGYLGNTPDIIKDPDEDTVGQKEIDTNFTETVTFSPPTGLSVAEQKARTISTTLIAVLVGIVIVAAGGGVAFMIGRKKIYK